MQFFVLFVVFISVAEVFSQNDSNSTSTSTPVKFEQLLQEPEKEKNVMKNDIDSQNTIKGVVGIEVESQLLLNLWMFTLFLITAALIKLGYHQSKFLATTIPESCVLIVIGLGFGTFVKILDRDEDIPKFTVNLFFFGLMPPIILDSAYTLHHEVFFNNIVTILMYAVVGTLINVFLIGISLYFFVLFDFKILRFPNIPLTELLLFSNAISAVDPVTVLNIFQDLKVNKPLYFLVFGESLLNDAVVIVLHKLLSAFVISPLITSKDILFGVSSFFFMSLGGFLIGGIFGILTSIITMYTHKQSVIEPIIMIGMAYLSFLTADILKWSGLISLIGCGLVQLEFANKNVSYKSKTTVKYFVRTLSSVSDLLIFFFLGQMIINQRQQWNTSFVVLTIIFCLLFRVVSVFLLTYISNAYFRRTRFINLEEQALMAYGGLRGAVAFAMIMISTEEEGVMNYELFKTTTCVVILFTVFILGGTTKPLLNTLRIQKDTNDSKNLLKLVNDKVIDTVISGIEAFVGNPSILSYIKHKLQETNEYLAKFLLRKRESKMESAIRNMDFKQQIMRAQEEGEGVADENKLLDNVADIKILTNEDVLNVLEKMAANINTNKNLFRNRVSEKLTKNPISITKVIRKHNIPHELSSKVISANETFTSINTKLFALRSDMNSKEIKQRIQKVGKELEKKEVIESKR